MKVPYDDFMGFRRTVHGPGDVVIEVEVDERHHNPMGVLHGGVLCGLLDSAMGATVTSLLAPGQQCTNGDLHARFLRPTTTGRLRASATVVKQGKTAIVMEAVVHNEAGDEVARGSSTFLVR